MSKRIAILLPSLIAGGAERSARFVAMTLVRAGYTVDFVAATSKGALRDDPFVAEHLVALNAPNELLCLPAYLRYLRQARPDLIISFVHSANLISGLGGMVRPDVPFIVSVRNTLVKERRDQWWVRRWFGFALERRLYRRARFVQSVSEALDEQVAALLDVPDGRRWLTYNSAQSADGAASPPAANGDAEEIAALGDYLVSAGRLVGIKGFPMVIRAFAAADIPDNWSLAIVGDGPMRGELADLIEQLGQGNRIRLVGYRDPVMPWLKGARGFVFGSRGEGFGRVLHEALMARLPVAACAVPGVSEVLGHGSFGRLMAPDDVDAMRGVIEDMVAGKLCVADEDALTTHLDRFTPAKVGARYVAMVEQAIGRP